MESRQGFYDAVRQVAKDNDLPMPEAYLLVEESYQLQHGQGRYVNYGAFYHSNYRAIVRAIRDSVSRVARQNEIYDVLDKFEKKEISSVDVVKKLQGNKIV